LSDSICKFIPVKDNPGSLKTINFVFETDFHLLQQPFFRVTYVLHLITRGSASLRVGSTDFTLTPGTLFLAFPTSFYEINASPDFEYIYISFMGSSVAAQLRELGIDAAAPVFPGYSHLIPFWMDALRRITPSNAIILTESVLLYSLSFFGGETELPEADRSEDTLFAAVLNYVDAHYRDADISLGAIASQFSYTEKYLSLLFKKNMLIGFNAYLTKLRIQYACELIERNVTSVSQIAALCGYRDSLYFSKVFKRKMGVTPTEHIRSIHGGR